VHRLIPPLAKGGDRHGRRGAIRAGLVLFVLVATALPATAAIAPKLRSLLAGAPLVVGGAADEVQDYASGRLAVAGLRVSEAIKGTAANGSKLLVVEMRELPTKRVFQVGGHGVAFLKPAHRTSFLRQTLPAGTYFELSDKHAFLDAQSDVELAEMVGIFQRLAGASSQPTADAAKRAEGDRRLVLDLIAARHPVLVDDGAASLTSVPNLAASLSETEQARLEKALLRADLEDRIRINLVRAVGSANLRQLIPTLQQIQSPVAVHEAAWKALDALGAAPPSDRVVADLAADDPQLRAAAARELLRREGAAAVSQVAPLALQDRDAKTREAVIDALGASKLPEALPPLERAFEQETDGLQQAAARAIYNIGNAPAAEAFGRLAFNAPPASQRYAVMLLLTVTNKNDPIAKRIAETHPDESVRKLIVEGLDAHDH